MIKLEKKITIYHGSGAQRPQPVYGFGKTTNDYGRGFYCTESLEMAKEWACADDSYFSYANDFIDNTLSVENLSTAMKLGKLGEQVVIISQKAFNALTFIEAIPASSKEYYDKYKARDKKAREDYKELKNNSHPEDGTYVLDIIRNKMQNEDSRLR